MQVFKSIERKKWNEWMNEKKNEVKEIIQKGKEDEI